jgi:hypothetical protein
MNIDMYLGELRKKHYIMKKLAILLIILSPSTSALAQETALHCELDAAGGSMPGFITHGVITLLLFALSMHWAWRSKGEMKSTDRLEAKITEELKQAA